MKRSIFFNKIRDRRIPMAAILLIGMLFCLSPNIYSLSSGYKYIKNYSPEEYKGQSQNWCILQDKRGLIYVGNHGGLLEFDGVSWRLISIPNDSVRSMAIFEDGTIYIGGINEIGYLTADETGTLRYTSLIKHIPKDQQNFSTVWRTHATKEGIYFRASNFLFRWDPLRQQMKAWTPENSFNASFVCDGKLYVHQRELGIQHIHNDTLELLPGGETFSDVKIFMLVRYDDQKLLIGTREVGFYTFNLSTKEKTPFPTEMDTYINEKTLYYGIRLSGSSGNLGETGIEGTPGPPAEFALLTLSGGLLIMDSHGKRKELFTKEYGLQNDEGRYVFEDTQGNLWLGLNKGISKIEYISPFSIYDDRSNLPGMVLTVIKHGQDMVVGTSNGLYFSTPGGKFELIQGITANCWYLISVGDSLLAGTTYGVFQVEGKKIKRQITETPSSFLIQSKLDPGRIWVGTDGLVSLRLTKQNQVSQWEPEYHITGINEKIVSIVEDPNGDLWLGTLTKGVIKVDFSSSSGMAHPGIRQYNTVDGLPGGEIYTFKAAGQVRFATEKGIFRYHETGKTFLPDPTFGTEFADGTRGVFLIIEDKNKNIWLHSALRDYQAIYQPGGGYVLNKIPFLRIAPLQVNFIYPDPDGDVTWLASHKGLIRYDMRIKKDYRREFSIFIRKVLINGNLHFDGFNDIPGKKEALKTGPAFTVIPYKDRNLRIEFAAPFFEDEAAVKYQYFLEGYEKNWSPLTPETQKDYTNLDSGQYIFRVRAMNVYETLSDEAVFQFRILPPWYMTWWAISFYVLIAVVLIVLIVKWRSLKLIKEKQHLEKIIEERTGEINEKNRQLELQTHQLTEQSRKLREMDHVKSRFFADISHEFRTPLTLIMAPLEQMLSTAQDKEQKKQIDVMFRNSRRLLTLINQLLDLSKIDSGKMKLQALRQNIIPFLKGILASFEMLAQQHKLELQFISGEEDITLYFDLEKIEQIMCNLLINAIKFTPAGGKIVVRAEKITPAEDSFLELSVNDTGVGIPQNQLDHIFDRFFQADSSTEDTLEHNHKGTGIGLALAKELVLLHHGTIHVSSIKGKGTQFLIRLPLGKEHLDANQIGDQIEKPITYNKTCEITASYIVEKEAEETAPETREGTGDNEIKTDKNPKPKRFTILVVDDSQEVRSYIHKSLEPDYLVQEATNGQEGIKKARKVIPDLIISDVMMPGTGGYELCALLKKDILTSHIPIILLTAKASEENIIQGLETGADDYITKPFKIKILITRIKNLIGQRLQLQKKFQQKAMLQPEEIHVSSIDQKFIKELQTILEKQAADSELNVNTLSEKMNISRVTLNKKILALTGETANQYIRSFRLLRAAHLLEARFGTVLEIAMEVGFSDSAYFTQCFKKKFNRLPSEYTSEYI